jgi:hypothetical protein
MTRLDGRFRELRAIKVELTALDPCPTILMFRSLTEVTILVRLVLALLLVVAILVCPYMCRTGEGCGCCAKASIADAAASSCPHGCCAPVNDAANNDLQTPQAPDDSCPGTCICNGALASADSNGLELQLQACLTTEPASVSVDVPKPAMVPETRSRADSLGSGLKLRIACCSWLC